MGMEKKLQNKNSTQEICVIWIDHLNRIISFQQAEGFEPQAFSTPEERLEFAFEKSSNGYRVQ